MDPRTAASSYKQDAFESAPPIKILRMLIAGAQRFLDQAAACDPGDPGSGFIEAVSRADAVVCELRLALDAEQSPELCDNLEQLYLFVESNLQRAQAQRDVAPLADARAVLATLLEAWSDVEVDGAAA